MQLPYSCSLAKAVLKYSCNERQNILSKYERIKRKLLQGSGNLTFAEIETLLKHLGFQRDNKGKVSGSRIQFYKKGARAIVLHRPHPRNTLLDYQIKQIRNVLKENHLL